MANEEQLSILKQGVVAWNNWRKKNPSTDIDLSEADLYDANLMGHRWINMDPDVTDPYEITSGGFTQVEDEFWRVNFNSANLSKVRLVNAILQGALLRHADLREADLSGADLTDAELVDADLSGARLVGVNLNGADLHRANLSRVDLALANLSYANLDGANLSEADLSNADLWCADFTDSNFRKALLSVTIFRNLDLSEAIGLDDVVHHSPSNISTDTLAISKGIIPEAFLRGCGLSDWEIESAKLYNPNLRSDEVSNILYKTFDLRTSQAVQISPLFISYSHGDSAFVEKIEECLSKKGIRFWRDVHDMKSGRMEKQIDRAIRLNPTVLLILSEHSLQSDWVEHEVRTARALEKELKRDVVCPVAIDDSWKNSPWAKRIMEQIMEYNIIDFSEWKDETKFESNFNKLIDGLELFYK